MSVYGSQSPFPQMGDDAAVGDDSDCNKCKKKEKSLAESRSIGIVLHYEIRQLRQFGLARGHAIGVASVDPQVSSHRKGEDLSLIHI